MITSSHAELILARIASDQKWIFTPCLSTISRMAPNWRASLVTKLHVMLASQATSIILRCSSESSCHFLRLTRNSPTEDC